MRHKVSILLLLCLFAWPAMAQRPLTIVGGVVTANVADTNDFQVILTANVTGITLVSTTGTSNNAVTPATGYQITMRFVQDATGSRTVTFGGNITTTCSVNATANSVTICRWQYTASGNTWADAGGGGGITPNNPIPANQAQGPTYNVLNYDTGTFNDAQRISDGVTAGGVAKTVTSVTANFVAGDVGKKITCISGAGALIMPIATIVTRNSATSVTTDTNDNGAANTLRCVWYTKNAGPAIRAAILAATPANSGSKDPNAGPTLGNSGTAYCPAGGYAVTVNATVGALLTFAGAGASIGPNFVGEGKTKCNIYVLPDSTDPGGPTLINLFNSAHSLIGGFSVDGLGFNFPFTHAIVSMNAVQHSRMYDVEITNISANISNRGTLDFTNSSDIIGENIFVQGASGAGNNDFACGFFGTTSSHFKNLTCSNHNQTAFFSSSGGTLRGVAGDNGLIIEDSTFDECGSATLDCTTFVAGYANFIGGWIGVGNSNRSALNVDGTSRVWLSNVNVGQFGSTNVVSNGITIASGGEVSVTMSDIRGNGSGANGVVVTGPAGAKLFDMGGNKYRNCVSAVCTDVSLANWATMGFTGGITPTFPLATNATTQLGARQTVTGIAPTFAVTGFGTSPTITVQTGSTDAAGAAIITAGTTPGSSGTFTLTFTTGNGAYGTNKPVCTFTLIDGTGTWNALAQEPRAVDASTSTTSVLANWADNSIALTAASTYGFNWSCYGK